MPVSRQGRITVQDIDPFHNPSMRITVIKILCVGCKQKKKIGKNMCLFLSKKTEIVIFPSERIKMSENLQRVHQNPSNSLNASVNQD